MQYNNGYKDRRYPVIKRGRKSYRASNTGMGYREWDEGLSEYERAILAKMKEKEREVRK